MNNPEDMPVDINEMRDWLKERQASGYSWSAMAKESGIPSSTLSLFAGGSYTGNKDNIAKRIFQYRQKVEMQQDRSTQVLQEARFIDLPSARRVQFLLEWAHMGRITVAAMGPGTCKSMTAEHYKASLGATVWLAEMRQTTSSVTAMMAEVMKAMGLTSSSGWRQQRSAQIIDFVRHKRGLLIIDEANHLGWDALEEIRGWHDAAGLGVALLGNDELMLRIRGGAHRHQYARLNSRIAKMHVQDVPLEADVAGWCDAMDIVEPAIRKLLTEIAVSPGHGGLREVKQILEAAHMLAIGEEADLDLRHFREAADTRTTVQRRQA